MVVHERPGGGLQISISLSVCCVALYFLRRWVSEERTSIRAPSYWTSGIAQVEWIEILASDLSKMSALHIAIHAASPASAFIFQLLVGCLALPSWTWAPCSMCMCVRCICIMQPVHEDNNTFRYRCRCCGAHWLVRSVSRQEHF